MIAPADQWGPFARDLDPAEYRARLRVLRAIARLHLGPRGEPLAAELHRAESSATALEYALLALDRLPSKDRRHVLASYAALHRQH